MIEIGPLTASHDHPIEELRQVLEHLRVALASAGAGPQHFVRMVWTTSDPTSFDPADFIVDLVYREVFAGFKPPIELVVVAPGAPRFSVQATVSVPGPLATQAVWRGYDLAALVREYSPRLQVPAVAPVFERWGRDGAAFLAAHEGHREIAYSPGRRQRFDLLMPSGIARPRLHVFIHGGYWQALDKGGHAQFTRAMLAAGFAVAVLNYSLAPEKPLAGLVDEIRMAIAFLWRSADALGLAAQPFDLAGHSAGAHLGAMAITSDWTAFGLPPDIIHSATLLSGLYELEPLTHLPMACLLGLDRIAAHLLSPIQAPAPDTRVLLAVGGDESDEFRHQTASLAAAWALPAERHHVLPGLDHFSILDAFAEGPLALATLKNATP